MHLLKSLRLKLVVAHFVSLILWTNCNVQDLRNCSSERHIHNVPDVKTLAYAAGSTNQPEISYSVLELLNILYNSSTWNSAKSEYIGVLALFTSNNSTLGIWQWSPGNNTSAHWHNIDVPKSQSNILSRIPRSHIGGFNASNILECRSCNESISGTIVPMGYFIRFVPYMPFWSVFEGMGETSFVFTAMKLDDFETTDELNSATAVVVNLTNWEHNLFVLRADWTDCTNELILAEPRNVDPCGICGGDSSTCFDCTGFKNGNATFKCGKCILFETYLTEKECQKKINMLIDERFHGSEPEMKEPKKAAIIGPSSMENLCDGHAIEIVLNEEFDGNNYTERSDYPCQNWTLGFEVRHGPPRNQADVLKIWDTIRNLQQNLNNQTQTYPGIVPRFVIHSSMIADGITYKAKLHSGFGRAKSGYGIPYEFELSKHPNPTSFRAEIMGPSKLYSDIEGWYELRIVTCDNDQKNRTLRNFQIFWSVNGTQPLGRFSIQNGAELKISKHFLQVGKSYNLTVFVLDTALNNVSLPISASKIIKVQRRKDSEYDFATELLLHTSQMVELGADLSNWEEIDEISGLEVYWRCHTVEHMPCLKLDSVKNIEEFLGPELLKQPVLRFPANLLAAGKYTWTVVIFYGQRHRTCSTKVVIHNDSISTKIPDFKIIRIEDNNGALNNRRRVDPSGAITATARVNTTEPVFTNAVFRWYVVVRKEQNESVEVEFEEATVSELNDMSEESTITITNLIAGAEYLLTLKFLQNDLLVAYEKIQVRSGKPPSGGVFKVEPANGVALRTTFVFQVYSWDSGNDDDSLRYDIGYTTPERLEGIAEADTESVTQWLQGHSSELTYVTDYLPVGDSSGEIVPVLRICDYLTCSLIQHNPITVLAPEQGYTNEDIRDFNLVLHEKLNSMKISEVLSYSYSVLLSLDSTNNSTRSNVLIIVQKAVVKLSVALKSNLRSTETDRIFSIIGKMLSKIDSKGFSNELSQSLSNLRNRIKLLSESECLQAETSENTIVRRKREIKNEKSSSQAIQKPTTPKPKNVPVFEFDVTSSQVLLQANKTQDVINNVKISKNEINDTIINPNVTKSANGTKEINDTISNPNATNSANGTKEISDTIINTNATNSANGTKEISDPVINTNITNSANGTKEISDTKINTNVTTTNSANVTKGEISDVKTDAKNNVKHTKEQILGMQTIAESKILNENSTEAESGIAELHKAARNLCSYVHNLGMDEYTISGNLTRVKVAYITQKTEANNTADDFLLATEGFKNNSHIKIRFRKPFMKYCSEAAEGNKLECHKVCYGTIYFDKDVLACSENPIWETMIIGVTNSSGVQLKNETEHHSPVLIRLGIDKPSADNFTIRCAIWNTQTQAWDTNQCANTTTNLNASFVHCECKRLGFYKLVYFESSVEVEKDSRNISKPQPELEQKFGVWFRMNGEYNEIVGRNKTAFEKQVWAQILEQFSDTQEFLYEITKVTVQAEHGGSSNQTGSIVVNLFLERNQNVTENRTECSANILKQLENALKNGSIVLTDLNNNTIHVPAQQLKRNAVIKAEADNGAAGWVILGAIICVGLFAIIVVVRKHKKEREDSVRPMRTEQYNLHGEPIPQSAIKPIRHVDTVDGPLNTSYSVTTMSTSFNSLPSPGSGTLSSKIQWHANMSADNLSDAVSSSPSPVRGTSAGSESTVVVYPRDQIAVSTNPMAPVDHSIPSFPNSTMY